MKKKRIFTIVATAIVLLACVWRMWPHTLKEILSTGKRPFDTVSVQVSEFNILDNSPNIDVYRLEVTSPEDRNYMSFMSIIESTKFRSDFRNLLPWDVLSVSSGTKSITHSAVIMLTWGDSNDEVCHITFHSDRIVSFDVGGKTEFLVYHPTNRTILNQIVTYTKENGKIQE